MIIRDLTTIRREALVGVLTMISVERIGLGIPSVDFIVTDTEPDEQDFLQRAAPYIAKPTHLKSLFVMQNKASNQRSVTFAVSDGCITVGAKDAPDDFFVPGRNIFIYRIEHIGDAASDAFNFLLSETMPYESHTAICSAEKITNTTWPILDESLCWQA